MSSQRGNVNRSRVQKHKNSLAFKNNKYDKSKRTEKINNLEVAEVCKRCQDIISWKIKYKKYKLLSQAKTCTKCQQRKITDAYHTVCIDCAKALQICCKCGKMEEIVAHKSPSERERIQTMQQLEVEVKALSERKRRAYYRYIEKLKGKKKKKRKSSGSEATETEKQELETNDKIDLEEEDEEEGVALSLDEYFKNARQKLEELQRQMEEDMIDGFDDFGIGDSSEEDDDDDDEYNNEDSSESGCES